MNIPTVQLADGSDVMLLVWQDCSIIKPYRLDLTVFGAVWQQPVSMPLKQSCSLSNCDCNAFEWAADPELHLVILSQFLHPLAPRNLHARRLYENMLGCTWRPKRPQKNR